MDKFDYLAHMFNIRTNGKKYENFIINAIYNRVNNKELVPVTQQYVRNVNDTRRYYLLDLYFPQINYGIEVDEGQHLSKINIYNDKERENAIKQAISCEEGRIAVFNADRTIKSLNEIEEQIDKQVARINELISEKERRDNQSLKWQTNDELKQLIINKGIFSTSDEVEYSGITEIYNITGHKAKQLRRCFMKLNKNFYLWVPTLAIKLGEGVVKSVNNYENYLTEDWSEIIEIDKTGKRFETKPGDYCEDRKRVVFMKMKDRFGRNCVKFIGVFQAEYADVEDDVLRRHYKRFSESVDISKLNP